MVVLLCFRSISVRRILKRSGPEPQKFEKNKGPNEHFWPKIFRHYLSIFCPKLGEDKKRSSLKFSPNLLTLIIKQVISLKHFTAVYHSIKIFKITIL